MCTKCDKQSICCVVCWHLVESEREKSGKWKTADNKIIKSIEFINWRDFYARMSFDGHTTVCSTWNATKITSNVCHINDEYGEH